MKNLKISKSNSTYGTYIKKNSKKLVKTYFLNYFFKKFYNFQ